MEHFFVTLNGQPRRVGAGQHNTTLLHWIRGFSSGTKEGCAEGDCGACTVAVLEDGHYKAINSCIALLPSLAGLEVWTAEGIAAQGLHPAQTALAAAGGSQCGYCTPGFVMSLFCEYHQPTGDETCFSGNLCRCTGYRPIRDALQSLEPADPTNTFELRKQSAPQKTMLEYSGFSRPTSLVAALQEKAARPKAQFIAGGTDLTLQITTVFKSLPDLISLEAVPELREIAETDEFFEIGAAVPLSNLEQEFRHKIPLFKELFPWFASRQIRHKATLGGNLGTASPIGDAPVVLLALDASLCLSSLDGEREIALKDYFLGYRKTALESNELIRCIRIPKAQRIQKMYKVAKRGYDDISSVMGAFAFQLERGKITSVRLAYGGVAAIPVRAYQTENALLGQPFTRASINAAQEILAQEFQPISDFRASAQYRQKIIINLLEKFFIESVSSRAEVHA